MRKPLAFLPEVPEDIEQARNWYAERNAEAANRFLDTLGAVLESIEDHPQQGGFYGDQRKYRYRRLARFPYLVVYREDNDRTLVVAVYHTSRRPASWKKRLDG